MKPYLTIKTVKDKKYIQISDINGHLIHIGPTSKTENWSVAYQALQDSYDALGLEELLSFKSIADEKGISLQVALDNTSGTFQDSEKWKAFKEKQVKKRLTNYAVRLIIQGLEIDDPQFIEDLSELEIKILAEAKTARVVGVSTEFLEMVEYLVNLY